MPVAPPRTKGYVSGGRRPSPGGRRGTSCFSSSSASPQRDPLPRANQGFEQALASRLSWRITPCAVAASPSEGAPGPSWAGASRACATSSTRRSRRCASRRGRTRRSRSRSPLPARGGGRRRVAGAGARARAELHASAGAPRRQRGPAAARVGGIQPPPERLQYTVSHGRVELRTTSENGRVRIEVEDPVVEWIRSEFSEPATT
jgi:hypothetical protein